MDTKAKILDIAMNLNRVGNWAADDYTKKQKRILFFLDQTTGYIDSLETTSNEILDKTLKKFEKQYRNLVIEAKQGPTDNLFWAEKMMTWGNILTHRTKLLD